MRRTATAVVLGAALFTGSAMAADRVAVGETAPGFTLTAADGSTHSLADLHGKSELVLVFFRGVW